MQTKLAALYLLLALGWQVHAQTTYDYLSRPGLTLATEHYNWAEGTRNNTYQFVGDSLLCDEELLVYQNISYFSKVLLRVEDGKVWRKDYSDPCNNEELLYDFALEVGDTIYSSLFYGYQVFETGTVTLLNGEERKRMVLNPINGGPTIEWIDGIGDLRFGLFPILDFEGYTSLVCVKEVGETIWLHPDQPAELCDSLVCPVPIPDFAFAVDLFQVNFDNHSINQSSVQWDFGDGETSTELNPSHQYQDPGCYNVTLTLGTDCLTGTFARQLSVPVCIAPEWQVKAPEFAGGTTRVDFVSESVGWAISLKRIWKTEDRGMTWIEQFYPIPPAPINRNLSTIDMADEMHGVIAVANFGAPSSIEAFLITNDGGQTWEEKMPGSYFLSSAIMTEDGQVFASGQFDGLFYSNDWGNSFTELPVEGVDLSRFQYLGNNEVVAGGLQGLPPNATSTISISNNSGQSWIHHLLPPAYYRAAGFHFFNANEGFVAGFAGFLIKTEDGGQTWQEIAYDDERKAIAIYFIDNQRGWAVGDQGLVLSTVDGGATWSVGNCGYTRNLLGISALDLENCWLSSGHGKYLELDPNAEADCSSVQTEDSILVKNNLLVFPNPTADVVTISLTTSDESIATDRVVVYNNLGQRILQSTVLNEKLSVNTQAWSPGVYWVKWFRNEEVYGDERLIVTP